MFKKRIYLDYASLTPVDRKVLREMKKYSGNRYANASSWYKEGVAAKKALEECRKKTAGFIHAHPDEIVFTSGGTEANNLAIIGAIEKLCEQGIEYERMHILISAIEHSSVRECANQLNGKGVRIGTVAVDGRGVVDLEDLKKQIRPDTALVSVMAVNNEIGTVQPLREIAKIIRHARETNFQSSIFNFQSEAKYPLFHTDAAQGMYLELNVEKLGADLLTLDGSKVYGPRGIGALYVKRRVPVQAVIKGGGQENGLRSGTENLPAIAGFAKALEIAGQTRVREAARLNELKSSFVGRLKELKSGTAVNGEGAECSPHIANVSILGIDSEFFVLQLDAQGIACSTKSSCLKDEDESYVLKSIGANGKNSVRFSFGRNTKMRDVAKAIRVIGDLLGNR